MNHSRRLSRGAAILSTSSALAMLGTTDLFAAEDNLIAEIVVSAQKRTENLQDVPASVSFGEEQVVRLRATQLTDTQPTCRASTSAAAARRVKRSLCAVSPRSIR